MRRSQLHLWVGIVGVFAFAVMGAYHMSLFLASAMNLVRGVYPSRFQPSSLSGKLEKFATPLMIVAPIAYGANICTDSSLGLSPHPLASFGSIMVIGSCALLLIAVFADQTDNKS